MEDQTERPIDRWFAHYSGDHRNPINQRIHVIAVPAILVSVVALLWCVPVPGTLFTQGFWGALAMFLAWMFYNRASRPLGYGMLALFVILAWTLRLLVARVGVQPMAIGAAAIFFIAWVAQFVGHRIEGRRPSFLTDLTYLLIGPLWVLAKLYRAFHWRYR